MANTFRQFSTKPWAWPVAFATWNLFVFLWLLTVVASQPPIAGPFGALTGNETGLIVAVAVNLALVGTWTVSQLKPAAIDVRVGSGRDD